MEQGNCLDSTPVSARYAAHDMNDELRLDAAITTLLTRPTDGAQVPKDDDIDLASACLAQVKRPDDWDADSGSLTEEEGDAEMKRWDALFRRTIETPSANLRDLAGKAHLMLADLNRFDPLSPQPSDDCLLMRVILAEVMAFGGLTTPARSAAPMQRDVAMVDPIYAVIAESRRLTDVRTQASQLPQPAGSIDPLPEQEAAADAFWAHVDDVLLKTVPTTAAGCAALARYTVEFQKKMSFTFDEDVDHPQNTRILTLIAQSLPPAMPLGSPVREPEAKSAKAEAEATELSELGIVALSVFYEKLGAAQAIWGGAMCLPLAEGIRLPGGAVTRTAFGKQAEFEDSRAGYLMDWVVNEVARRPAKTSEERDCRLSLLIQHEIACEGRIRATDLLSEVVQAWGRA